MSGIPENVRTTLLKHVVLIAGADALKDAKLDEVLATLWEESDESTFDDVKSRFAKMALATIYGEQDEYYVAEAVAFLSHIGIEV